MARSGNVRILSVQLDALRPHCNLKPSPGWKLVVGLAVLSACMPRDRINASCEWVEPDSTLPLDAKARRAHLALDIRIAKDLGIRHGDSVGGRMWNDANRTARERCTQVSAQRIRTLHPLASGEFEDAERARNVWIDALLVMLPGVLLFAAASRFVVRRAVAGYDAEDRWISTAVLVVLTPIVAAAGLVAAQIWSVVLESILLGSEHISYRASELPLYRHRIPAYCVALLVFSVAAIQVLRRRPQRRVDRRVAAQVVTAGTQKRDGLS